MSKPVENTSIEIIDSELYRGLAIWAMDFESYIPGSVPASDSLMSSNSLYI